MRPLLFVALFGVVSVAGEEAAPRGVLTSGTVTLLSRARYNDYEKATFSFEHGIRDDPGLRRTRNDWELEYGSGGDRFSVRMVVDDRSVIVDLGLKKLEDITALPALPAFKEGVTTRADAIEGHAYAVRTRDSESDHVSAFRVVKLVPGDSCTIEWVHWRPAAAAGPELELTAAARARLSAVLDLAAQVQEGAPLRDPVDVLLRVSTGSQGGNTSRLALDGPVDRLPADMTDAAGEDEVLRPRERGEAPIWSWRGGHIPKGRVLVVESIDVCAISPGDSNGHGEAVLELPSRAIVQSRDGDGPFQVWLEGLELVRPGEERNVLVRVANSSAIEARIRGRLVTVEEAGRLEPKPLAPATAPAGVPRAGGRVEGLRPYTLEQPWLILQVRAGAGGGNPNRVTMLGRGSPYLDRMSTKPIDVIAPVDMHEDAVGYSTGARIPPGKILVLKKATWIARAGGDSNGHGEALLRIGSEEVFRIRDSADEQRGSWAGEIEIRPGAEESVCLEVANSSVAEVILEGAWK